MFVSAFANESSDEELSSAKEESQDLDNSETGNYAVAQSYDSSADNYGAASNYGQSNYEQPSGDGNYQNSYAAPAAGTKGSANPKKTVILAIPVR